MDFLIVGAGLTGATAARALTEQGYSCLVVDQREHVGGNVHDHVRNGIRVHTYGPHYFRTNNDRVWAYVNRFASWWGYEPCLLTDIDGQLEHWPITTEYIAQHCPGWRPTFQGTPTNFEQACLAMMPEQVYEQFVKGYTEKQWGHPAHTLAAELAGRFAVQPPGEHRLKTHKHQGVPTHGYAAFMEAMLDGIRVELNVDDWKPYKASHVIYTGTLDGYHDHRLGRLRYRGQHRYHQWHPAIQQPCGQINYPSPDVPHIRSLEWTWMAPGVHQGSIVTTETPDDDAGDEYPFPDRANRELAARYRALPTPGTTICGRLGLYRYIDMDAAIALAMVTVRKLTGTKAA